MDAPPNSSDLNPAPTWLVRETTHDCLTIVSRITVHSLVLCTILDQCKVSYISPLIKKTRQTGLKCDICLESVWTRGYKATWWLRTEDKISQSVSVCISITSFTEMVLHEMRSDILFAVDRHLVDVPVTAAFQTIDHAIFLNRLVRTATVRACR